MQLHQEIMAVAVTFLQWELTVGWNQKIIKVGGDAAAATILNRVIVNEWLLQQTAINSKKEAQQ